MKNNAITEAAEAINTAHKNVEQVREAVQAKRDALADAQKERDRLQELIIKGDTEAMTQIVDARATVDGLTTHLQDLNKALAGAEQNHQVAVAQHQRARVEALDVDGLLTEEQLRSTWVALADKIDSIVHPELAKAEAHNTAFQELGKLIKESEEVLGGGRNKAWSSLAGIRGITDASIHGQKEIRSITESFLFSDHVGKSYDRYRAQRHAA